MTIFLRAFPLHSSVRVGALALSALLFGCAAAPPAMPDENQLAAAGFQVVVAKTVVQQEHLRSLAPGKVSEMQRNGTHFFVYPDVARNVVYVGTQKEYAAYLGQQPGNGAALTKQQAVDMASYNKQDAGMRLYNTRDLNDPYYFWDSWDGLSWR